MKRKRNSEAVRPEQGERQAHESIDGRGTSILDIPEPILINVVLRLPIKVIIMCKCVCKPWRRLISDPHFARIHFANAQPCPLIRTLGARVSRMLYLIEPSEINVSYNHKNYLSPDSGGVNLKLDTRLKIPLRNPEMVPYKSDDGKLRVCSSAAKAGLRKRCVKVRTREHKYKIVNSCNGFLCLSDPLRNDPLVVCNPITGEYLNLPKTNEFDSRSRDVVSCGFGYCEEICQYKVVRMIEGKVEFSPCPITGKKFWNNRWAEVHTLGTDSWRHIGHAPSYRTKIKFPTCLNGSLHWINTESLKFDCIYAFDLSKEKFKSVEPPPIEFGTWLDSCGIEELRTMTLGVLRGSLSLCVGAVYDEFQIWILQNYNEPETWRKFISIDVMCDRWPCGMYLPINFQENKGILMFQSPKSAFFYYDPQARMWKYFRLFYSRIKYEAVAHTPSFIALKDVVKGDSVEILNINSRCTEFKLLGETKAVFLLEEFREVESDTDCSSYSSEDGDEE